MTFRKKQNIVELRSSGESIRGVQPEIALKVKQSAAELKNFVQEWTKLHFTGVVTLNNVKIIKLDSILKHGGFGDEYPEGLQERCDILQSIIEKMEKSLRNLSILVQQFDALVALDVLQGKSSGAVFRSWSMQKFQKSFFDIHKAYSKEFSLKCSIMEEVGHCSTKESLIFQVTSWESQPFIDNSCQLLCESLFSETDAN